MFLFSTFSSKNCVGYITLHVIIVCFNALMSRKTKKIAQQKIGEKIIELGNLALAGIVFVQLIPQGKISIIHLLLGILLCAIFYVIGYLAIKGS